jgi:uncharacterized protein (DUF58 family)
MTKFGYAATLAASLAALCVRQRDAVGLTLFDAEERLFLRPAATQAQLARIIDALERARPDGRTDLGTGPAAVCGKIRRRGMVILVSDLLVDLPRLYDCLGRLRYQGHDVIVLHVLDRDEIELPFEDSILFRDLEGAEEVMADPWAFRKGYRTAMDRFIDEVRRRCRFGGIDHVLMRTDQDLGPALSHYLHRRLAGSGRPRQEP